MWRYQTTLYISHRPQISRNLFVILFICCARVHFAVAGICDLSFLTVQSEIGLQGTKFRSKTGFINDSK